ncbi:MAG TPA: hypothetical protein PLG66_19400, partial [Calditrichia bacterium]|nr:hypothetical protein [Calditrichia bacterium]
MKRITFRFALIAAVLAMVACAGSKPSEEETPESFQPNNAADEIEKLLGLTPADNPPSRENTDNRSNNNSQEPDDELLELLGLDEGGTPPAEKPSDQKPARDIKTSGNEGGLLDLSNIGKPAVKEN